MYVLKNYFKKLANADNGGGDCDAAVQEERKKK